MNTNSDDRPRAAKASNAFRAGRFSATDSKLISKERPMANEVSSSPGPGGYFCLTFSTWGSKPKWLAK